MPSGIIEKIPAPRDWENRDGETIQLHSFKLEGDKAWYRTGETPVSKLGGKVGLHVTFDMTPAGNVSTKGFKVTEGSAPARAPSPRQGSASSGASSKDDYWSAKEAKDVAKDARYQTVDIPRMTFCGAQEAAVEVLGLALQHGAVVLPATKKKSEHLELILEMVDKIAVDLFRKRMDAPSLLTDNNNKETDTDGSDEPEYSSDDE